MRVPSKLTIIHRMHI